MFKNKRIIFWNGFFVITLLIGLILMIYGEPILNAFTTNPQLVEESISDYISGIIGTLIGAVIAMVGAITTQQYFDEVKRQNELYQKAYYGLTLLKADYDAKLVNLAFTYLMNFVKENSKYANNEFIQTVLKNYQVENNSEEYRLSHEKKLELVSDFDEQFLTSEDRDTLISFYSIVGQNDLNRNFFRDTIRSNFESRAKKCIEYADFITKNIDYKAYLDSFKFKVGFPCYTALDLYANNINFIYEFVREHDSNKNHLAGLFLLTIEGIYGLNLYSGEYLQYINKIKRDCLYYSDYSCVNLTGEGEEDRLFYMEDYYEYDIQMNAFFKENTAEIEEARGRRYNELKQKSDNVLLNEEKIEKRMERYIEKFPEEFEMFTKDSKFSSAEKVFFLFAQLKHGDKVNDVAQLSRIININTRESLCGACVAYFSRKWSDIHFYPQNDENHEFNQNLIDKLMYVINDIDGNELSDLLQYFLFYKFSISDYKEECEKIAISAKLRYLETPKFLDCFNLDLIKYTNNNTDSKVSTIFTRTSEKINKKRR